MALTWEDVVEQRFRSTTFREGYDQEEVDDFLDAVAVELRRLAEENARLRAHRGAGPAVDDRPTAALAAEKAALEAELERLRALEGEYRARLTAQLEEQLRALRTGPAAALRGGSA